MEQNNLPYNYLVCFEYEGKSYSQTINSSAAPGVDDIDTAEIAVKEYIQTRNIKKEGLYPRNINLIYKDIVINHWNDFFNK